MSRLNLQSFRIVLAMASVALLPVLTASAQRGGDGSVYSRFGIGELRSFGSSQAEAMGGSGFAMGTALRGNFSNPAGWGDLIFTRLQTGLRYESVVATNAAADRSETAFGTLDHVAFSFPILSRRLGIGMSFSPFSRVGYTALQEAELEGVDGLQDPTAYDVEFSGGGGLQRIDIGLGARLTDFLSVGVAGNVIFGIIDEVQNTSFDNLLFGETTLSYSTRLSGASATLGVTGNAGGVLRSQDALRIGLTVGLPVNMDGRRVLTIGQSLDKDTLGTEVDVDLHLPVRIGGGIVYAASPRVMLMIDGQYEPWTKLTTDVPFPGISSEGNRLEDRLRVSLGVELLPGGNDLFSSYLKRIAYRVGVFTDKSYVQPIAGETLRTMGASAGLSFPTRIPGTRIDMNFQVGRRGDTVNGLIKETFYRFGINVNIGERWFEKTRLG